jgi:hypothetical protein
MIVFVVSPPLQPPFCGGNREKIQQKIVKDKIKLPGYLSSEAHALLKGVISSPQNIYISFNYLRSNSSSSENYIICNIISFA